MSQKFSRLQLKKSYGRFRYINYSVFRSVPFFVVNGRGELGCENSENRNVKITQNFDCKKVIKTMYNFCTTFTRF